MGLKRPVYLDLFKITLPLPGLSSICHRVSGVFMLTSLPLIAYLFILSVQNEEGFLYVSHITENSFFCALWLWAFLMALTYHVYSGIRHLLMDLHFFEELHTARISALIVFILFAIEALLGTLWFWGIWP